jgi:uncharacterized protein
MTPIRFGQVVGVPWKNGGGVTREIAVYRDATVHSDFLWRVSLATISASGPFSHFQGIDRSIAVLKGAGMLLSMADGDVSLNAGSAPFTFAGEQPTTASLIAGETIDLNAMTARNVFHHKMERVSFSRSLVIEGSSDTTIVVFTSPATASYQGERGFYEPLDALVGIKRSQAVDLTAASQASVVVVRIDRRALSQV